MSEKVNLENLDAATKALESTDPELIKSAITFICDAATLNKLNVPVRAFKLILKLSLDPKNSLNEFASRQLNSLEKVFETLLKFHDAPTDSQAAYIVALFQVKSEYKTADLIKRSKYLHELFTKSNQANLEQKRRP